MVAARHITVGSRSAQSKSGRVAVERGAQPKHSAPCKARQNREGRTSAHRYEQLVGSSYCNGVCFLVRRKMTAFADFRANNSVSFEAHRLTVYRRYNLGALPGSAVDDAPGLYTLHSHLWRRCANRRMRLNFFKLVDHRIYSQQLSNAFYVPA